ncbi:MAG: hypothetical protein ACR2LF_06085 [Jatrophihabitantaceae bacterium]
MILRTATILTGIALAVVLLGGCPSSHGHGHAPSSPPGSTRPGSSPTASSTPANGDSGTLP